MSDDHLNEQQRRNKAARENEKDRRDRRRGNYHTDLGGGGYITAKFGGKKGGVKNPKASGFVSMKAPNGAKTSLTFLLDGKIERETHKTKGNFLSGFGGKKKR